MASSSSGGPRVPVFIGKAADYSSDIESVIRAGLDALGIGPPRVKGKSVILKPNLVEAHPGRAQINTHPAVVRAAASVFRAMGASRVRVAEGPGHRHDIHQVLDESGMGEALREDGLSFVDLNYDEVEAVPNQTRWTKLPEFHFPRSLREADWIVSMPKMKTHHWVGATLAMKNLFGVMPGIYYGWPKNVLHQANVQASILDIYGNLRPHLAIVDGIIGMEGDGPILGAPKPAGVLVMGEAFPAVDATCARIMDLDPERITYLAYASRMFGPISEAGIEQRGESAAAVMTRFELDPKVPEFQRIRPL